MKKESKKRNKLIIIAVAIIILLFVFGVFILSNYKKAADTSEGLNSIMNPVNSFLEILGINPDKTYQTSEETGYGYGSRVECNNDSECYTDGRIVDIPIGDYFCDSTDRFSQRYFANYICQLPGTTDSFCELNNVHHSQGSTNSRKLLW